MCSGQLQKAVAVHLVGGCNVCIWQLRCVQGVSGEAPNSTSKEGVALSRAAVWDAGRPPFFKGLER